jgi:AcrR family transcriptional regulator
MMTSPQPRAGATDKHGDDATGNRVDDAREKRRDEATGKRRADAAENRARIIEAARSVMSASDEVRLNAIAKQAGVGQGTLYRHFPTREALLAEVYRRDVDELVAAAPALLAAHQPLQALALWFGRVADYARVKRGVFAAVEVSVWQDLSARSHGPIGDALTLLLDSGKADGTIRPDVDARDVIILIGYLSRLDEAEAAARGPHLLHVILDGLRRRGLPRHRAWAGLQERMWVTVPKERWR